MAYISVNAHTIRKNAIHGTNEPPIRIARTRSDKMPKYAHEVELIGKSKLVYDAKKKILACGARLVLIADDVKIIR